MDREWRQRMQTPVDLVGGKPVTPLGDQQSVAHLQMPVPRDQRLGVFQMRQRRLGPRFGFVVEQPGGGYRGIDDERGYQRWPSWRAARISSVDISMGFQPARRCRNRSTAAARSA